MSIGKKKGNQLNSHGVRSGTLGPPSQPSTSLQILSLQASESFSWGFRAWQIRKCFLTSDLPPSCCFQVGRTSPPILKATGKNNGFRKKRVGGNAHLGLRQLWPPYHPAASQGRGSEPRPGNWMLTRCPHTCTYAALGTLLTEGMDLGLFVFN